MALARIVVLISGRGSNLEALLETEARGELAGTIIAVISNRASAHGLTLANERGVATAHVDHKAFASREAFDAALAAELDRHAPDLVVLAGFMRVLGAAFVQRYAGRMINIHPSLLPAYAGLHTHRRALADEVATHGCTVHFVTPDVDGGPVIVQGHVPVLADDDEARLAARVLEAEHRILPRAVNLFCEGRLRIADGRVQIGPPPPG
ncbi:MAG TPA: phosphoribosylglycinamide formyltransferase [Casimicrobiaceae bacterium]|nr:phosphoribosylglycinamide formyltransferase [Casimicrobiaceae bacterium]